LKINQILRRRDEFMENIIFVTGGKEREKGYKLKEWHRYECALILKINIDKKNALECVRYVSPPEVCPDEKPSILFKSATLKDNKLYTCTSTEIIIFSFPDFKQIAYISIPLFNDIHHVLPSPYGNIIVVNTGLDMVLEIDLEGKIINEWSVIGENIWKRFSKNIDYRKVPTTKPHKSHPNYAFYIKNQLWVTRFEQKDAICLEDTSKKINIKIGHPHDGCVYGDFIYFTTVNGYIVVANTATLKIEEIYDLNEITKSNIALGWCRGIYIVNQNRVWVGFTRLRPTPFREHISWIKRKLGLKDWRNLPTRIVEYDLFNKKILKEINLENFGLNTVFSLHLKNKKEAKIK